MKPIKPRKLLQRVHTPGPTRIRLCDKLRAAGLHIPSPAHLWQGHGQYKWGAEWTDAGREVHVCSEHSMAACVKHGFIKVIQASRKPAEYLIVPIISKMET